jgi:hypothetical protein
VSLNEGRLHAALHQNAGGLELASATLADDLRLAVNKHADA